MVVLTKEAKAENNAIQQNKNDPDVCFVEDIVLLCVSGSKIFLYEGWIHNSWKVSVIDFINSTHIFLWVLYEDQSVRR